MNMNLFMGRSWRDKTSLNLIICLAVLLSSPARAEDKAKWSNESVGALGQRAFVAIQGRADAGGTVTGELSFHCVREQQRPVIGFVIRIDDRRAVNKFDWNAFETRNPLKKPHRGTQFRVESDAGELLLDFRQSGRADGQSFEFGFSGEAKDSLGLRNLLNALQDDPQRIDIAITDPKGMELLLGAPVKRAEKRIEAAMAGCVK